MKGYGFLIALFLLGAVFAQGMTNGSNNGERNETWVNITVNETQINNTGHEIMNETEEMINETIEHGKKWIGRAGKIADIVRKHGEKIKEYVQEKIEEMKEKIMEKRERAKEWKEKEKFIWKEAMIDKYRIGIEISLKRMEIQIQALNESGVDVSELKEIYQEAYAIYLSFANESKGEWIKEFRDKVHEFREIYNELKSPEVQQRVEQLWESAKQNITSMRSKVWQHLKEVALMIFDHRVAVANHTIQVWSKWLNVTPLEEKLQEIEQLRDDLASAYDSQNRTKVMQVMEQIKEKWKEFRQLFAELVVERAKERMVTVLERIENKIEEIKGKCGNVTNTSALDSIVSQMEALKEKNVSEIRETVKENIGMWKDQIRTIVRECGGIA